LETVKDYSIIHDIEKNLLLSPKKAYRTPGEKAGDSRTFPQNMPLIIPEKL